MRWALTTLAAILMLASCTLPGKALQTPTVAPYTGARTNGVPTPGEIRVTSNDTLLTLEVAGEVAAVADQYSAAWRADGWQEYKREQVNDAVYLYLARGAANRLLTFSPFDTAGRRTTLVIIPPP